MSGERMSDAELIRFIDDAEEDLSTWECDFIESCLRQIEAGGSLTTKRRAKAEEIFLRLSGGDS